MMIAWLLSPIDPTRLHDVEFLLSWHARLMVAAWAFCAPVGIIVARFFKVWPGQDWPEVLDNRAWWNIHRGLQYTALVLMVAALAMILLSPPVTTSSGPHRILGWIVLGLAALQIVGALLRGSKGGPTDPGPDGSLRGDHYDMTLHRRIFEWVHKTSGYTAVLLSVVTILYGLWQANAPVWMWVVLIPWWLALGTVFVLLHRQGRRVTTYQAIWGLDPRHPGNMQR